MRPWPPAELAAKASTRRCAVVCSSRQRWSRRMADPAQSVWTFCPHHTKQPHRQHHAATPPPSRAATPTGGKVSAATGWPPGSHRRPRPGETLGGVGGRRRYGEPPQLRSGRQIVCCGSRVRGERPTAEPSKQLRASVREDLRLPTVGITLRLSTESLVERSGEIPRAPT